MYLLFVPIYFFSDSHSLWHSQLPQEGLVQWETGAYNTMGCRVPQYDGPCGSSSRLLLYGPQFSLQDLQVSAQWFTY